MYQQFYFCFHQGLEGNTPKKEREDAMRNFKDTLTRKKRDHEFRLEKHQKDTLEFNLRAFKRRKILQHHRLEQKLLQEVIFFTFRKMLNSSLRIKK